jgi:hypothetical protein
LIDLDKIIFALSGSKTGGDDRKILNKAITLAQEEMLEYLKTQYNICTSNSWIKFNNNSKQTCAGKRF